MVDGDINQSRASDDYSPKPSGYNRTSITVEVHHRLDSESETIIESIQRDLRLRDFFSSTERPEVKRFVADDEKKRTETDEKQEEELLESENTIDGDETAQPTLPFTEISSEKTSKVFPKKRLENHECPEKKVVSEDKSTTDSKTVNEADNVSTKNEPALNVDEEEDEEVDDTSDVKTLIENSDSVAKPVGCTSEDIFGSPAEEGEPSALENEKNPANNLSKETDEGSQPLASEKDQIPHVVSSRMAEMIDAIEIEPNPANRRMTEEVDTKIGSGSDDLEKEAVPSEFLKEQTTVVLQETEDFLAAVGSVERKRTPPSTLQIPGSSSKTQYKAGNFTSYLYLDSPALSKMPAQNSPQNENVPPQRKSSEAAKSSGKSPKSPFGNITFRSLRRRISSRLSTSPAAQTPSAAIVPAFPSHRDSVSSSIYSGIEDESGPAPEYRVSKTLLNQMLKIQPGQPFNEYTVDFVAADSAAPPANNHDNRPMSATLGSLGELRHLIQTASPMQVKKFIRNNDWKATDRIRCELWKDVCKRKGESLDASIILYKDELTSMQQTLQGEKPMPMYLGGSSIPTECDRQLNAAGKDALCRVLSVLERVRPDFVNAPLLYPLAVAMLHYMSDEEAFACIQRLLSQGQRFIIQTNISLEASKTTVLVLLRKNLVRTIDCFLYEGQKVLFRVVLSLLIMWYKFNGPKLKTRSKMSSGQISSDIATFIRSIPISVAKLLKIAFGIRNFKSSTISNLQEKHEAKLRSGELRYRSNFGEKQNGAGEPEVSQKIQSPVLTFPTKPIKSAILKDPFVIRSCLEMLPPKLQILNPIRLFISSEEGRSFTRLWNLIDEADHTLLIIETSTREVFGAYCSTSWSDRKRLKSGAFYFGSGETYLFTIAPEVRKFEWVGLDGRRTEHSEDLWMSANASSLILGGGGSEGLSIRDELVSGFTNKCDTFANEPLCPSKAFEIRELEVFGFIDGEVTDENQDER